MGKRGIQKTSPTELIMFHKAIKLEFKEGTSFDVTFSTGEVKRYDISVLFNKYPQLKALTDRKLFVSGKLMGAYGIMWNDDLDIETETVYEDGVTIRKESAPANIEVGNAVLSLRAKAGLSQADLSLATGIDQSDISKIERGISNPSILTLKRIATATGTNLKIAFD